MKLIFPTQGSVAANHLIIFSEAKSHCVLKAVAEPMKLLDAELMIACPEDQFQRNIIFEKRSENVKLSCDDACIDLLVFNDFRCNQFRLQLSFGGVRVIFDTLFFSIVAAHVSCCKVIEISDRSSAAS